MTIEEKILDVMNGMKGMGSISSPEEYYVEFDMRVRATLGLTSNGNLPDVSMRDVYGELREMGLNSELADKIAEWSKSL